MKKFMLALLPCLALMACGGNGSQAAQQGCDPSQQQCGQVVQQSNGHPLIAGAIGAAGGALVMHHYMNNRNRQVVTQQQPSYYGQPHTTVVHHYYPQQTTVVHHYGNSGYRPNVIHVYHHR